MDSETRDNSLSRSMGPVGAIATVIAGTLGAGLFVTVGTASSTTGPSVILAVALLGVVALAVAINYGWMATIFPAAGGAYTFVSRSFNNRLLGFVVTWTKWLGYMAAVAVVALGFGSYLNVFFPNIPAALSGFVLLTVLFLINLVGVKGYSVAQSVLFWFLIATLLVLVIPGLFSIDTASYQPFFTGGVGGFATAMVPLFFAFLGIEVAAQFGAEVRNPGRNLPLAMLGGTVILILLYLLTAVVIYGVVSDYTVLSDSAEPLAAAASTFLGGYATAFVAIGGLLATASTVHAVMAAAIKIPYSWSWDGVFPERFSTVSERFRTPHWSLLTLYVAAAALTFWSSGVNQIVAIATFSYLIAYLAVSLAAGYLYLKRADEGSLASQASFQPGAWFYLTIPVAILGSAGTITQAANWGALFAGNFGELSTLAIYIPWLALGLVIFGVYWYRGRQRDNDIDAILNTIPGVSKEETGHEPEKTLSRSS